MKILLHAREAGIATQLSVIRSWLEKQDCQIYYDLNAMGERCLGKQVVTPIDGMDYLICGYDSPHQCETDVILDSAKKRGIKSIGILDCWKGIDRFWKSNNQLRKLADMTVLPDKNVHQYLMDRHFNEDQLSVALLPKLSVMSEQKHALFQENRLVAREKLNIAQDEQVVLFFSEPLQVNGNRCSLQEMTLSHQAENIYDYIAKTYGDKATLLVRHHPVEKEYCPSPFLNANHLSNDEALSVADLVVGMGTTMMIYAAYLGVACKSLFPLLEGGSPRMLGYEPFIWRSIQRFFDNRADSNMPMLFDSSFSRQHYLSLVGCDV